MSDIADIYFRGAATHGLTTNANGTLSVAVSIGKTVKGYHPNGQDEFIYLTGDDGRSPRFNFPRNPGQILDGLNQDEYTEFAKQVKDFVSSRPGFQAKQNGVFIMAPHQDILLDEFMNTTATSIYFIPDNMGVNLNPYNLPIYADPNYQYDWWHTVPDHFAKYFNALQDVINKGNDNGHKQDLLNLNVEMMSKGKRLYPQNIEISLNTARAYRNRSEQGTYNDELKRTQDKNAAIANYKETIALVEAVPVTTPALERAANQILKEDAQRELNKLLSP